MVAKIGAMNFHSTPRKSKAWTVVGKPGMNAPAIAGDIRIAEGIVEEGVIAVKDEAGLRTGMALKAVAEVREALDRISRELEGVDSVAELAEPAKVTVFNEQERINTILTQAKADSRLVCDHSRPTGSNRKVTKCQTVAERRRRMEADRDHLQRNVMNGIGPPNN